jgi:hypothetical protein
MECLQELAGHIEATGKLLKLRERTLESVILYPANRNRIYEGREKKIAFCSKPLHLPFVRYPLVSKDFSRSDCSPSKLLHRAVARGNV